MASSRGRPPIIVCVTDGTGSHRSSPAYPAARLRRVSRAERRHGKKQCPVHTVLLHGVERTERPLAGNGPGVTFLSLWTSAEPASGPTSVAS
ncbi:MAG: hypothetical protein WAL10_20785 [Acetobacteraceae bacterium]